MWSWDAIAIFEWFSLSKVCDFDFITLDFYKFLLVLFLNNFERYNIQISTNNFGSMNDIYRWSIAKYVFVAIWQHCQVMVKRHQSFWNIFIYSRSAHRLSICGVTHKNWIDWIFSSWSITNFIFFNTKLTILYFLILTLRHIKSSVVICCSLIIWNP
jgi:hypothetical protein